MYEAYFVHFYLKDISISDKKINKSGFEFKIDKLNLCI